jgi:serine protease Do
MHERILTLETNQNEQLSQEPQEIVSCYMGEQPCREVVSSYVQERPLPRRIVPPPARPPKRKKHNVWIFLICLVGLFAIVLGAGLLTGVFSSSPQEQNPAGDDSTDPSSIIHITPDESNTTIPRTDGDASVRLICTVGHSGEELTASEVFAKVNPAVVTVLASQDGNNASMGTGIIFTADGYVVTNAHVVSGGKTCTVVLDTGAVYEALLVGMDSAQDIAVLKMSDAQDLPTAEFGNSDETVVGETVYAIGNPLALNLRATLTNGLISAINRQVTVDGNSMKFLQTNAALNNGNSGGPLINAYGQVIGINTMKMNSSAATVEGLGFALPISEVSFVVNDLIAFGSFHGTPLLGVTVMTAISDDGSTRLFVQDVSAGFGGAKAGLQAGDEIIAADGTPVSDNLGLLAARRNHTVGDTLYLTVVRQGQQMDFAVPLLSQADNS